MTVGAVSSGWSPFGEDADHSFPAITTRGQLSGFGSASELSADTDGDWEIDDTEELFVFIHGWGPDDGEARSQAETAQRGLSEYHPLPVVAFSWDGEGRWSTVTDNADANAEPLAEWLVEFHESDGRPVHLLGYSLGSRVACETLSVLVDDGRSNAIDSVSLLGAAIDGNSVEQGRQYGDSIEAFDSPVANFYSQHDSVLARLFDGEQAALGQHGITDPDAKPSGYEDVDVSETVADHHSYHRPDVGCMDRVVDAIF